MGIFKKKKPDVPNRRRTGDTDLSTRTATPRSDVFRRGRTIVGSITSIQSSLDNIGQGHNRSNLNVDSARTHVHHLSIKRRKLSGLLVVSVLAITILWLLVSNFTASLTVGSSNLDIVKPIDEKSYIGSINNFLDANPLSRLSFLMDDKALNENIGVIHPEIQNVRRLGNTLKPGETKYIITFRNPVAGWQIKDDQYYVDSKGASFERNYFSDPSVQIVDSSGISPQTGVAIASKRFLSFVGRVVALSKANGYEVTQAVLPKNTTRELDVYIKGLNSYVKLSVDRGVGEQIEDMSNSIKYFVSRGESPKYIDIRVSGKAFYRY